MSVISSVSTRAWANGQGFEAQFQGALYVFPGSSTSSYDLRLDTPTRLQGGTFWVTGANVNDKVSLAVVDVDNVLGGGADAVVAQYVNDLPLPPWNAMQDLNVPTAAQIPAGLYLRTTCLNTGADFVTIGITFRWFVE